MQTLGKIPAGICAVMFIVTGLLALFLFNIERTAFSAQTYKQAFERQQIYKRMPSILASALTGEVAENPNADPFLRTLTQADWEKTILLLIPPEELKGLADNTLDSAFEYVNGRSDSASVSLSPFKNRLAGPAGVEAVKQLLQAQPACTTDQLLQLGMGFLQGNVGLCNPPQELMGLMSPLIESQLRVVVISLPDNVNLLPGTLGNMAGDLRVQLNRARTLMKLSLILPFLFLLGLTLLTMRRSVDFLKWVGVPFIITGATGAITALLIAPTMNLILLDRLQNRVAFLPPVFLSTFQEGIGAVSQEVLAPVVVQGAILVVFGIAMLLVVFYLSTRGKTVTLT